MARGVAGDVFGKAGTELKITDNAEGKSISTAEATDEYGNTTARETFEAIDNPTATYTVAATFGVGALKLGELIDNGANPDYIVNSVTINTSQMTAPTIGIGGESVPTASVEGMCFTIPAFNVLADHKAQILFGAFTLAGAGCSTHSCNATCSASITRGLNEDGETASFGVSGGAIEVTAEIEKSAATAPTITPASNWTVTSPLTLTETGVGYQMYSVTLKFTPTAVPPA